MAADLIGFLAGKKDVQPFHPVNQIRYVPRLHLFLYESDMYGDGTEQSGDKDSGCGNSDYLSRVLRT